MKQLRKRLRACRHQVSGDAHLHRVCPSSTQSGGGAMISTFEVSVLKKTANAVALLLVFVLLASSGFAQQLTGTLSATITDAAGAVVPNAKVTMKNDQSGDVRTTVTNGSGYFTVTAVQPGSYSVTVEAAGFKTWQQTGIVFAQ